MEQVREVERAERCMVCQQNIYTERNGYAKVMLDAVTYYMHLKVCLKNAQKNHAHLTVIEEVVGKGRRPDISAST
jgi:hypothetical protein